MSASQRRKGATFERQVIGLLREHGWAHARRTSDGTAQHGRGDIANGPPGCHLECKRSERTNIPAAMRQAIADADKLDIPIVIHRPSRCEVMATLPLSDLLDLLALRDQ